MGRYMVHVTHGMVWMGKDLINQVRKQIPYANTSVFHWRLRKMVRSESLAVIFEQRELWSPRV